MLDGFDKQFLGFILLNGMVLTTASFIYIWLQKFKIKNWGKIVLSVSVLCFLQIFLSQIILGSFGILTFKATLILNLIIFLFVAFLLGKNIFKKTKFITSSEKNDPFALFAIFSPFIVILLIRYFNALLQVPLEYDNIAYHLPFVVEWFQTKSLLPIYYSAFAGPLGYYPSNFELLDLWAILPFGKDFFVNLLNLPIFVLLFLAIYQVSRNFNIQKNIALITAALFLYMPQIFRQMGVPLVDLFFSFTFITTIYFLQEFWKTKSFTDLILFSLSAGLFIGTKYLGIPYIIPLFLIASIILIFHFWKKKKQLLYGLLIIPLGSFIGGGFWYIRNWLDSGNPLFPVDVQILGIKLFEGYHGLTERLFEYSLLANVKGVEEFNEFLLGFFHMAGGLIGIIVIALLLLIIILLYNVFRLTKKKNKKIKKEILLDISISGIFIISLIFYFYLYWRAPYSYINLIPNVRYAMMFLFIGCLSAGFAISRIKWLTSFFYLIAFTVFSYNLMFLTLSSSSEIFTNDKLILDIGAILKYKFLFIEFILIILIFIFALRFLIRTIENKKYAALTIVLFLSLFFMSKHLSVKTFTERESLSNYYYSMWFTGKVPLPGLKAITEASEWLDENANHSKIAYTGFNFHYHLFGRELQREVDYININDCTGCRYADFKNSKDSIRRDPDFNSWLKNLQKKSKEYIVISPSITPGVDILEFEWTKQHPEYFYKVFEKENVFIYKINNEI